MVTARLATRAALAAAVLFVVGVTLGPWALAGLIALGATAGLVAGWAAVEARVFPSPPALAVRIETRGPVLAPGDHVAFARALTAVSAAYLAECERQEHEG